jgi:hypothetical protein
MDKDNIILKHQQLVVEQAEEDIQDLQTKGISQEQSLQDIQDKLRAIQKKTGKKPKLRVFKRNAPSADTTRENTEISISYEEVYAAAYDSLVARGLDPDSIDYADLISQEELDQIIRELNAPLPRQEKWTKADFIVVFIAALIGGLADIFLSNRNNNLTGQQSKFSKWLNDTFHEGKHATNAPIDYQGKHFGGGYHRELSKGHDILRFVEGIKMFKEGKFEAIRYENGVAKVVITTLNQYGKPYEQLGTIEAIARYAEHMFADLFSKVSLPFPGYSFLAECNNRDLRKFAADMYHNGFNIKNIIIQSASTAAIEIIVRIYYSIQSVKKYRDSVDIAEDYSNFEAIKEFVNPGSKEKMNEMLLLAHAIVMAINAGKVVITKNLAEINVTEIMSVIRYGSSVLGAAINRNHEHLKVLHHAERITNSWSEIETLLMDDVQTAIDQKQEVLTI